MTISKINLIYESIIDNLTSKNYAVCDDFFTNDEVSALRQNLVLKKEKEKFRKVGIGNVSSGQVVKSMRGDSILWIDESCVNEVEKMYFNKVNHFIDYLNSTCFLGIEKSEFHYAVYPEGTFYRRHLDVFQNDDRRMLSIVFYLNQEDWQADYGGELALYLKDDKGVETCKLISPVAGRLVVFESKILEHEVKQVKHPRYSITGWLKTR